LRALSLFIGGVFNASCSYFIHLSLSSLPTCNPSISTSVKFFVCNYHMYVQISESAVCTYDA